MRWIRQRLGFAIALLVALAYGRLLPLAFGRGAFVATFQDDAFYYFQIARHVASGHGSTFDGIHATNGYQPLWLVALLPIFRAVGGDLPPVVVAASLETLLLAAAVWLLFETLRRQVGDGAAAAGSLSVVALPGTFSGLRDGMESALSLLLLVCAWRAWLAVIRLPTAPLWRWLVLGTGCTLAFLARLEALALVPAAVFLGRRPLADRPAAAAALLLPPAVAFVGLVVWGRSGFETWLPISGAVRLAVAEKVAWADRLLFVLDVSWPGRDVLFRPFGVLTLIGAPRWVVVGYGVLVAGLAVATVTYRRALLEALARAGVALPLLACEGIVAADQLLLLSLQPWQRVPIWS